MASITPIGQPRSAAIALQRASRPQPICRSGNGSSSAAAFALQRGHRADLDEPRAAREHARAAAGDVPGGVRGERVRGLRELEPERLGERDEAVEEAARQHDVVVDDQQPVGVRDRRARRARR